MADNHTASGDSGHHKETKTSSANLSMHENPKSIGNQQSIKSEQQEHKPTYKFKQTPRQNSIQTSKGIPNTSNLRKTSISKTKSLMSVEDANDCHAASSGCVNSESTSSEQSAHAATKNAVSRTTSESLRLNAMSTIPNDTHSPSNSTSNSSLARVSYTSKSSSNPPRSTPKSYESQSSLSSKTTSANSNIFSTDGNSANTSRTHHSHGHGHGQNIQGPARKPKTTSSFQITSVTVGQGKKNSDNGEESADDLDESQTEETSRTMDLESDLPSMSETTFSKDEVFFANSALSSTAPAIPTSSQYGLVVVDPIGANPNQHIQNAHDHEAENIISVVTAAVTPEGSKKKEDIKDAQHRSERFKVVKIESTEPFRRGRWMCMDYLDNSTVGNTGKEGNNNEQNGAIDASAVNGDHSKTTQSMIIGTGASTLLENNADSSGNYNTADGNWNFSSNTIGMAVEGTSPSHQQLNQHMIGHSGIATAPATMAPGMPHAQDFLKSIEQEQLQRHHQLNTDFDSQNTSYNDALNKNESANSTEPSMDFATVAAQQLQKSLQQLKEQEEAIEAEQLQSHQNQISLLEQAQLTNPQMTYAEVAQQNAQQDLQLQQQLNVNLQQPTDSYVSQQQPNTLPTHSIYEDMQAQQQQRTHVTTTAPSAIVMSHNLQQQLSQTDGTQSINMLQQTQPTQFQQTVHAQSIPMMVQTQQHHPTALQQSVPATLGDGNTLLSSLQAVQRQNQVSGLENLVGQMTASTSAVSAANFPQQKNMDINENITNIANVMNMIKTNATMSANTGDDLNQQHHKFLQANTESETER